MKLAAVDIGTNSMRLLIVHHLGGDLVERGRWQRVTGLGSGVDSTGMLSAEAMDRTLLALAEFGGRMEEMQVTRRRAVATSASRDAANRDAFFDRAEIALGVRPELITGEEEATLAFLGATSGLAVPPPYVVIDIGGGSTEFVTVDGSRSVDIGSVRLTERVLVHRPARQGELTAARQIVQQHLAGVTPLEGTVIGVAGTWTSLAGINRGNDETHLVVLTLAELSHLVETLSGLTVEQTADLPGFDPARASVILAGALIAEGAMSALAAERVLTSDHDLLDGVVRQLVGVP